MNEFELRRQLRALAAGREPSRDLWPDIATRLGPQGRVVHPRPSRRPNWGGWAAAASLVAMAVLLWPSWTAPPPSVATVTAPGATSRLADPMRWQADALRMEYAAALAQLADAPLPPELRPVARELRASEQALREALRVNPESTYLLGQLRRTYEQQLRLSQLAALG